VDATNHVRKWSHKITNPHIIAFWLRKGLRDSVNYPPGPVVLEIPVDIAMIKGTQDQLHYCDVDQVATVPKTAGDPVCVQKVVETLLEAKRPVIVAGDGIYWSDASSELVEFAELIQIPVCTRRMARGALPENHSLAWTPSLRRGFLEDADVVCLIGHTATGMDGWFQPPEWPSKAKYIQVEEIPEDIWYGLPTQTAVIGSSKLVLRQMIEYARSLMKTVSVDHTDWVGALKAAKEKLDTRLQAITDGLRGTKPIHPHVLAAEIVDFLDPSATMIYDSLTMSTFITERLQSRFAGQILDAGLYQTLGHSVGMAIGAQVARPGKQIVTVIGDGGFGISAMDLETMAKEKLPIVNILLNNSSWGGRGWAKDLWYPPCPAQDMLPDIRYDQMFKKFGCHTEFVTEDSQIRPALDRAFKSGCPSLINVIGDSTQVIPFRAALNLMETWAQGPDAPLAEEAREEMKRWGLPMVKRTQKLMRDTIFGYDVPLKEIADAAGVELE
jgi:acetolactate synthase-1/2/3 large subunit